MSEHDNRFVERYNKLHDITRKVASELTPNGIGILPLLALSGSSVRLGIDDVVGLVPESESVSGRDHLIHVHLAALELYMYRHGYCPNGHMIRILAGNYRVATPDVKQSIIDNGFRCVVAAVSSANELEAATPLRSVSDREYSDLYERLTEAWGSADQKRVSRKMQLRLRSIHDLLPQHKIGADFRRERRGRREPLPMFVRNEIHHPTKGALLETEAFQQDKRIGYAIMEVWLSQHRATERLKAEVEDDARDRIQG